MRRLISDAGGEIRPTLVLAISALTSLVCFLLVFELGIILLSLAGVDVFKYLLGSSFLSWLAHRIYQ